MGEGDGEMVDYSLQIERDIKEENKVIEVNDIGGKGEDPLFTQEIDYSELDELNIEPLADHFLNDSRKKESGLGWINKKDEEKRLMVYLILARTLGNVGKSCWGYYLVFVFGVSYSTLFPSSVYSLLLLLIPSFLTSSSYQLVETHRRLKLLKMGMAGKGMGYVMSGLSVWVMMEIEEVEMMIENTLGEVGGKLPNVMIFLTLLILTCWIEMSGETIRISIEEEWIGSIYPINGYPLIHRQFLSSRSFSLFISPLLLTIPLIYLPIQSIALSLSFILPFITFIEFLILRLIVSRRKELHEEEDDHHHHHRHHILPYLPSSSSPFPLSEVDNNNDNDDDDDDEGEGEGEGDVVCDKGGSGNGVGGIKRKSPLLSSSSSSSSSSQSPDHHNNNNNNQSQYLRSNPIWVLIRWMTSSPCRGRRGRGGEKSNNNNENNRRRRIYLFLSNAFLSFWFIDLHISFGFLFISFLVMISTPPYLIAIYLSTTIAICHIGTRWMNPAIMKKIGVITTSRLILIIASISSTGVIPLYFFATPIAWLFNLLLFQSLLLFYFEANDRVMKRMEVEERRVERSMRSVGLIGMNVVACFFYTPSLFIIFCGVCVISIIIGSLGYLFWSFTSSSDYSSLLTSLSMIDDDNDAYDEDEDDNL